MKPEHVKNILKQGQTDRN